MCTEPTFYVCKKCGNLVGMVHASGAPMTCCGEEMKLLKANTVEASKEKHIPVITLSRNNVTVKVGAVEHPMTEEHYIQWVYLETAKGGQRKCFKPGDKPEISFIITADDSPVAAYAYCNLHGLWKASV